MLLLLYLWSLSQEWEHALCMSTDQVIRHYNFRAVLVPLMCKLIAQNGYRVGSQKWIYEKLSMSVGSPMGGEGYNLWLFSSAGNNAYSPWTSEAVNRGQGRKIGPKPRIFVGIQFTPVSWTPTPIMLSPLHPRCDPSSDELSPNRHSLQGVCVGQYVWNQLYKGDLSPLSLCIQAGHAQLLGQGELGATGGAAALLRSTPLLLSFGQGCPTTGPMGMPPTPRLQAQLPIR